MVTAAFSLQKSLPVPTPQEAKTSAAPKTLADFEDDPQWIVVKIDSSSTFHVISGDIDKETPSRTELLVQLRQARARAATHMLVVAHGDARHEQVIIAMDAGSSVGLEDVKLLTVEEDF
jgi:biopolymer transport protein ExbD